MRKSVSENRDRKRKLQCVHCGDSCRDNNIKLQEHIFCCQGCRLVYEIIHENGLMKYYQLEDHPGLSLKNKSTTQYEFLDDEDIQQKLIDFQSDDYTKVTFHLPAIHCASCIWLLENLYKMAKGVTVSKVDFLRKQVSISFDHHIISLRRIVEILDKIGYSPALNMGQLEEKRQRTVSKKLIYQIGVVGFCFGNIMLLSFPEYLGVVGTSIGHKFNYLNWVLGIPVLVYGASDYIKSAFQGIKRGYLNMDVPITLGIIALFLRSTYDIFFQVGSGYMDSLAGLVFFLLVGKWFQQKTFHHLSFERDYKSYFPIAVSILENGQWVSRSLSKIKIGDSVRVKNNQLVPADGILKTGRTQIDYSFVTGESMPVTRQKGDKIYAGGKQIGHSIDLDIVKTPEQSYLLQLWEEKAFSNRTIHRDHELANRIGKYFTLIILSIASITFAYWYQYDLNLAFKTLTAVLIIACPCALALAIPFTYGNVIRLLAHRKMFLRSSKVIEDIQQADTIVFDKTGTLTSTGKNRVLFKGPSLNELELNRIYTLVSQSGHPHSHSIKQFLQKYSLVTFNDFVEIPGSGIRAIFDNDVYQLGSPTWLGIVKDGHRLSNQVYLQINGKLKGSFVIESKYRRGWRKTIKMLAKRYQLSVVSGDSDRESVRLSRAFPQDSILLFNQKPKDKLEFIKLRQETGSKIMMIGDGINDAGALQQSEVGIVITEDINNFTPASDVIIEHTVFDELPRMLKYITTSRKIIYGAYVLALIYNVVGLSFAVRGLLSPIVAAILMPASSLTMVVYGILVSSGVFRWMGLLKLDKKLELTSRKDGK